MRCPTCGNFQSDHTIGEWHYCQQNPPSVASRIQNRREELFKLKTLKMNEVNKILSKKKKG